MTRRQGIELALDGRTGRVSATLRYTLLDATFGTAAWVNGDANSSNDGPAPGFEGTIAIRPGDRIPLIPRHILRAGIDLAVTPRLTLGGDLQAQSGIFARGDEDNAHRPDGAYYLGPGGAAGFAIVDLNAEWRPRPSLKLYAELGNAVDAHYATAAQLSRTGVAANGAFVARPFSGPVIAGERPLLSSTFQAPGAPRALWLGVKVAIGRAAD